jgi:predicted DNA-binding transcriptional regulator YafY
MRAARLVSEILLLQQRGRLTAFELADELNVSVRTIYRDIEALHLAGVPVFAEAGHRGGYQLVDGYRTRLTGLTRPEVEVLFLTGLPGPAAQLGLEELTAAAELKIASALPAELRQGSDRIRRRFHLDAPGWYHDGDEVPHLAELAGALWQGNTIEIIYRRWKEPTDVTRRLQPFGLVLKAGTWYLIARSTDSAAVRTYRVGKILRLAVLHDRFEIPADFELSDWWRRHLAGFKERLVQGSALVRFSPEALARLPDLVSSDVQQAVRKGSQESDGWRRALIPIESLTHAQTELLRFGAEVEVLEPTTLRKRIARTSRRLHELYNAL